jgi:hypothetical protein
MPDAKTFDCVEMKREAQRRIGAEYEARKREFASYWEFLNATAAESAFGAEMLAKFARAGPSSACQRK